MLKFIYAVSGVSFRPEERDFIAKELDAGRKPFVKLEKDPTNPYDPNAIKVIVDGKHIGFVPAKSTDKLHSILDNKENNVIVHNILKVGGSDNNAIGFRITTYYGPDFDENMDI